MESPETTLSLMLYKKSALVDALAGRIEALTQRVNELTAENEALKTRSQQATTHDVIEEQ